MEVCYKKFLQRDYITLYKGKFLQRDYITLYKGKVLVSTLCIMFLVSCLFFFYTAMLKCFFACFVASVINVIYLNKEHFLLVYIALCLHTYSIHRYLVHVINICLPFTILNYVLWLQVITEIGLINIRGTILYKNPQIIILRLQNEIDKLLIIFIQP